MQLQRSRDDPWDPHHSQIAISLPPLMKLSHTCVSAVKESSQSLKERKNEKRKLTAIFLLTTGITKVVHTARQTVLIHPESWPTARTRLCNPTPNSLTQSQKAGT